MKGKRSEKNNTLKIHEKKLYIQLDRGEKADKLRRKKNKQPFTHSEPKQTSKHEKQKHPHPFHFSLKAIERTKDFITNFCKNACLITFTILITKAQIIMQIFSRF